MHLDHKARWVFSPLVDDKPIASEYALQWEAPMHHDGFALVHCIMNAHQLAAAKRDPRLIVLPSVHAREKIHPKIAEHHSCHGLHCEMLLHEALCEMAKHHPNFEPEE